MTLFVVLWLVTRLHCYSYAWLFIVLWPASCYLFCIYSLLFNVQRKCSRSWIVLLSLGGIRAVLEQERVYNSVSKSGIFHRCFTSSFGLSSYSDSALFVIAVPQAEVYCKMFLFCSGQNLGLVLYCTIQSHVELSLLNVSDEDMNSVLLQSSQNCRTNHGRVALVNKAPFVLYFVLCHFFMSLYWYHWIEFYKRLRKFCIH